MNLNIRHMKANNDIDSRGQNSISFFCFSRRQYGDVTMSSRRLWRENRFKVVGGLHSPSHILNSIVYLAQKPKVQGRDEWAVKQALSQTETRPMTTSVHVILRSSATSQQRTGSHYRQPKFSVKVTKQEHSYLLEKIKFFLTSYKMVLWNWPKIKEIYFYTPNAEL